MKKFNIHEWQAKQRSLTEARKDTPGENPKYFYDDDSIFGKLKKDPDYIKKLNAKNTPKKGGSISDEEAEERNRLGIDEMEEHHDDEDFPGKDLSAWDLLDKIKSGNTELYNKVEDFMKSMKEMNSLGSAGAGASFDAGKGAQYATPKAFGGSKNKKEVLGYKKVKDLNEQNSPKWWKKIK